MKQKFLGALIALVTALAILPARADDPNRLTQLKISVWLEYDRPTVLVMLDGALADQSNLPREVSVLIPSGATSLVTTWANPDGSFAREQPSQAQDLGNGFTRVTFTVTQPNYHVEYYHDALRGAPNKTLDFVFQTLAPADQLTLEFQQPLAATNFSVSPATPTTRTDSAGFKYFILPYSNVAAGQTIAAQVKYTKTDPNPSVSPTAAPETSNPWNTIFVLVALISLGLVIVLGIFIWQQNIRGEPIGARSDTHPVRHKPRGGAARAYCSQCGHALNAEDNFCPRCGAKRRRDE